MTTDIYDFTVAPPLDRITYNSSGAGATGAGAGAPLSANDAVFDSRLRISMLYALIGVGVVGFVSVTLWLLDNWRKPSSRLHTMIRYYLLRFHTATTTTTTTTTTTNTNTTIVYVYYIRILIL